MLILHICEHQFLNATVFTITAHYLTFLKQADEDRIHHCRPAFYSYNSTVQRAHKVKPHILKTKANSEFDEL